MRLYLRSTDRLPDPDPEPTDLYRVVVVGIGVWVLLGVVALVVRDSLIDNGSGWFLWTPPIGVVLGLFGLRWVRRVTR